MKMIKKIIYFIICCLFVAAPIFAQSDKNEEQSDTIAQVKQIEYVPYGIQEKDKISSAVFSISGDELRTIPTTDLLAALQGRMPGLSIVQLSGDPSNMVYGLNIRGVDSGVSNGVLTVVDGVERHIADIDINEIERVTLLKDAAAVATYGMRGSNGVIMVTTKRGYTGKSKIDISVNHSFETPTRMPDIVNAYDYTQLYNQRVRNDYRSLGEDVPDGLLYSDYEMERYRLGDNQEFYPTRNFIDELTKDYVHSTRANINFTGGNQKVKYFVSMGYLNKGSLFEDEVYDEYYYDAAERTNRFNFRTNLDISLNPTLDFFIGVGGYLQKYKRPFIKKDEGWDYLMGKLYETPNNAYNDLTPDGEVQIKQDRIGFRPKESVYGYLNRTGLKDESRTRLCNTFSLEQKLEKVTPGLKVRGTLSFDIHSKSAALRKRSYEAWEVKTLQDVNGVDSIGYSKVDETSNSGLSDSQEKFFSYMYNYRAELDYARTFSKHDLSALVLYERQMNQKQQYLAKNYLNLAGRASYVYDNRYVAELNMSYQGSEQFAPDNRWGFFPSASVAWVLSNESFLKENKTLNYLKMRSSYGRVGNSVYTYGNENQYLYLQTWHKNGNEDQLGNMDVTWEKSDKFNLGIDAQMFKVLTMGMDVFFHSNNDIMVNKIATAPEGFIGLSSTSGITPPRNMGEIENKGLEAYLSFSKQFNSGLTLQLNGNIAIHKNKQIEMGEMAYDDSYAYPYRKAGYAVDEQWGYLTEGLFQSDQEAIDYGKDYSLLGAQPIAGDIKYRDLNGDNVINDKDKAPLGNGQLPRTIYGFQAKMMFKGFDLTLFFNGMANRQVYLHGFGQWSNNDNFTEYMKDAWSENNRGADYPRLGNETPNYTNSDYWLVDGSYLRLRNAELGYTLPKNLTRALSSESIRFYVNGSNLLVFDNLPNDDIDPELANTNGSKYPLMKALNIGLVMKF